MGWSAKKACEWAKGKLGSKAYYNYNTGDNYCQKFVADACCYGGGQSPRASKGSAAQAKTAWMISTDKNPPAGAAVYLRGSGSVYGHVGISLGNGQYIHAWGKQGVILSSIASTTGYYGWGWNGGQKPYDSETVNFVSPNATYATSNGEIKFTELGNPEAVQIFHAQSLSSIPKWGLLRYFEEISTPSIGAEKATRLLELHNHKTRLLKVKDAVGHTSIRAGSLVPVNLDLGDVIANQYMLVQKVTHTFSNGEHKMDLDLEGVWDD